jgi:nucleoid-associated protein YgaU
MFAILIPMSRTRVRRRRVVAAGLLGLALATVVNLAGGTAGAGPEREGHSYVVRPGDTVWSIAVRQAGPGVDPRPLVDAIVEANGVDPGTLAAGQTLVIPAS